MHMYIEIHMCRRLVSADSDSSSDDDYDDDDDDDDYE